MRDRGGGILVPAMAAETAAGYEFGPFRLDLQGGELWRGQERLLIRPKVFALLVVLIENRGTLLTKETLLEQVWGDVVVSETSLSRTVADLRELLQDDADQPRYVETTPKRGYKFVAPVIEIDGAPKVQRPSAFTLLHGTKTYPLHDGDHLIGRGEDVAIPLFTALVSRHHACVHVAGETVTVEDLGSMNGTRVNQQQLSGTIELRPGDQIEIGGERLVLWSPSSSTKPAAI
jgi:DNA-binding winged helix-turn-helix (wHTH) protein